MPNYLIVSQFYANSSRPEAADRTEASGSDEAKLLTDAYAHHLDGLERAILRSRRCFNGFDNFHAGDDTAEDGMLARTRGKPIEKVIVNGVDEELATARVGAASVGHRQRSGFIGNTRGQLVLDRAVGRVASAGARAVGVAAMRAAELDHEVLDHTVKMQAVVETFLGQAYKVAGGDGHLVDKQFDREITQTGFDDCRRIWRGCR